MSAPRELPQGRLSGDEGFRRLHTRWIEGHAALDEAFAQLRSMSSRETLSKEGVDVGFRVEDLLELELETDALAPKYEAMLRRLVGTRCKISVRQGGRGLALRGLFAERDGRARSPYVRVRDRLQVEAFELHVVEHCNLRCAHCCNMSPYLDGKTLSVAQISAQLEALSQHLHADVFKIMGGEPLLHPDITEVLRAIPRTGIADTVRLFTNGLLLSRMEDAFWEALDQLTVSSYSSAPVKPDHLAMIVEKARRFDVILNVKHVEHFSEVMSSVRRPVDDAQSQAVYDACWLRDRCLIARDGRFFKCTRAAYLRDTQSRLQLTGEPFDEATALREWETGGVPLDAPDLGARLLAYMNDEQPLPACRVCQGSQGPLVAHHQLKRRQVEAGEL
ncbi:MAG: radical SAM protein [Polyangia bacterium]